MVWKINFHFFIIPDAIVIINPNCLRVAPPYPVTVVKSQLNFSKAFPVKWKIAGYNLLKTEIGIKFAPAPVSILHFTCTLDPVFSPFYVLLYHMYSDVGSDLYLHCMLWQNGILLYLLQSFIFSWMLT